jgi:hypothetical protein
MTDLTELYDHLKMIKPDRALTANFAYNNAALIDIMREMFFDQPDEEREAAPFPAISDMTAVQATVFDNWPNGTRTKGRPNRFGMALEVWNCASERIDITKRGNFQFKSNIRLLNDKELIKRIADLTNPKRKLPISQNYADALGGFAGMDKDCLVGLINSKQVGTTYFEHQFVFVDMAAKTGRLFIGDECVDLVFSGVTGAGAKFNANIACQARVDLCGFSETWAS